MRLFNVALHRYSALRGEQRLRVWRSTNQRKTTEISIAAFSSEPEFSHAAAQKASFWGEDSIKD
jgi:hypothetical protein